MRKLVVTAFATLDGVVQSPGGPDEDRDGGFAHGGWAVPGIDEQVLAVMGELTGRAGALLLGRRTYDIFAATWPLAGADDPLGARMNELPKHVVSRTPRVLTWTNATQLDGGVAEAVAELKGEPGGEIQVHGSGALVQALLTHDLVDELHLLVFPVLLGTGKRLFGGGTVPVGLRLVSATTTATGVVIAAYARGGGVEYGAMGPETGNW
ncbi:dihydrofolate reductase family protein [Pseudonocardia humida]|uniref:Dihydrofolate reductase n=1 Tax=Pseudonocardia humida TaxID=2800819 RepID=A0ABT0ZZI4_9PSEU|nr:dihydrofolate reductase family protein [Pseudonocardia humida]MCO1656162.1 dihydrofolate reductase [Pseudonocardia humida]